MIQTENNLGNAAGQPRKRAAAWLAAVYWVLLAGVLALALYLRVANLGEVQHFLGDQGRDYFDVMKWFQRGEWPLLGPLRSVGDWGLGPGWYYTIAPAMALSDFHPAAGAATIAIAATLTIALLADWLRRTGAGRAAALVTAAVMAFSSQWTWLGRTLWNPHMLPLGVAALAWLIAVVPRRPVPALSCALMLMAILPQWHTTGLLVDAAAMPFLAWAFLLAWPAARATRRLTWVLWSVALLAVIALLYVPPAIYELKPGPGNLVSFFKKTNLPAKPATGGLARRAVKAFDLLASSMTSQSFSNSPVAERMALRSVLAAALALVFGVLWGRALGRSIGAFARRRAGAPLNPQTSFDPSVSFLALLVSGFWLIAALKGDSLHDYFLLAAATALLMLAGWTAGRLLAGPLARGWLALFARLAGGGVLTLAFILALAQLPRAWAVHGDVNGIDAQAFRNARKVAEIIARDSDGRPFSVELAEENNFVGHYFYLLNRLGRPPLNEDYYDRKIPRNRMGTRMYIIAGPGLVARPDAIDMGVVRSVRFSIGNMNVHRIDVSSIPPEVRTVKIGFGWSSPSASEVPWAIKGFK